MKNLKRIVAFFIAIFIMMSCNIVMPVFASNVNVEGWQVDYIGNIDCELSIDKDNHASGNSSLEITNKTSRTSNVYFLMQQQVNVEAGKRYYVGAKVKSEYADTVDIIVGNDWSKRYKMTTYGSTYDWTNFEGLYKAETTGSVPVMLIVEGTCKIWIDDFKFEDIESGKNLIINGSFESGNESENESDSSDNITISDSFDDIYKNILSSEVFSLEDMEKVNGGFKYIPVHKAEGITIDANSDDWQNISPIAMPTLSTQYQVYMKDSRPLDIKSECKFAYDEDYLYMLLEIDDDINYSVAGDDLYWTGDSIQFTVSNMTEGYGTESGLSINPQTQEVELHNLNSYVKPCKAEGTIKKTDNGTKTIYEIAYPWLMKFSGKQDMIKFDILANDNDGDGRRYCAELSPGISEGKTNVRFPILEMLDGNDNFYGWIQSTDGTTFETGKEVTFDCFVVNKDNKEISVEASNNITNQTETLKVPANSGIHKQIKYTFTEEQEKTIEYVLKSGDKSKTSKVDINAVAPMATVQIAEDAITTLKSQAKEVEQLIDKCHKQGISTYYEDTHLFILQKFCDYIREDIDTGDLSRVNYTKKATTNIYKEDIKNLNEYLAGTKKPLEVPEYVTSKMTNDNTTFYADVENTDGEIKKEPVFMIGYGHSLDNETIEQMRYFGGNATQFEIGPRQAMSYIPMWNMETYADAEWTITNSDKFSGNSAFEMKYKSPKTNNQYILLSQKVKAIAGHKYRFSGKIKAKSTDEVIFYADYWTGGGVVRGTNDWQDFSYEITATKDIIEPMVIFDSPCESVLLDDISLVDTNKPNNELIKNGDFEEGNGEWPVFCEDNITGILEKLEICEENNISVSFLISPHYFIDEIVKKYNIPYTGFGFLNYDVNSEPAKQIMKEYLSGLLPMIRDYNCIANITISNEPYFRVDECNGVYNEAWWAYLKEIYGDIDSLNKAYNTSYTSFEEVKLEQDRSIVAENYDYYEFNTKTFAAWHKYLAELCHEYAPGIPVQAKAMGYMFKSASLHSFSAGINYELFADFIDVNGCDYGGNMGIESQPPLGKEMTYDYMQSILDKPVVDSENHNVGDGDETYTYERALHMAQDVYNGVVHGRNYCVSWILRRESSNPEIMSNILYRPDALAECADTTWDLQRLTKQITALQKEPHEIGILYTNENALNLSTGMNAAYETYTACCYEGKIPRFIVETQLDKMQNYKILIVPNVVYLKKETLNAIKDYISNGGKVIILGEDTLTKTERNADTDSNVRKYIFDNSDVVKYSGGFDAASKDERESIHSALINAMKECKIMYGELLDAKTGKRCENVEYELAIYDGKLIFNISNFSRKAGDSVDLELYVNGEKVKNIKDLRSMENIGDTISLGSLCVSTYEAEIDNPFFDTYEHWGENEIVGLYHKGVVKGVSASRFNPNGNITRAEFLALLMRNMNEKEAAYSGEINDVSKDSWYAGIIASAIKLNVIDKSSFRPDDKITREEICELIKSAFDAKNVSYKTSAIEFNDKDSINSKDAVGIAVGEGIVKGYEDNTFRPLSPATRAEAVSMLNRIKE